MIIIITLQQLYEYIYYKIHTVFKSGSVIYSNVLKEVSSQQSCIYLFIQINACLIQEGGLKKIQILCFVGIMPDRMLNNVQCCQYF